MRRFWSICSILLLTLIISGCGCKHQFDEGKVTKEATCSEEGIKTFTCSLCGDEKEESIECIPHTYEQTVVREATFDKVGELKFTCVNCGDSYTEEIPVKEKTAVVTVTNKTNVPKDIYNGRYSDRIELIFNVENQGPDDIKGVQGVLHISDMFDKKIMDMNCDFTGQTIAGNTVATYSNLGIDVNEFIDEHTKLYNENFADLVFDYEVTDIVYVKDMSAGNTETTSDKIKVDVIDKANVSRDIYNGVFSPYVKLSINVTNNTDKVIKGISGTLQINNLFGKKIIENTCDFTGQQIDVNSTVNFDNLSLEINEFIDEHNRLYNENFDDLKFVYKVNSIVYDDGTTETIN